MQVEPIEYAYRPRGGWMLFGTVFFSGCALVLRTKARENDRGLILNGIIELSASGATTFYWALVWTSVAFVAIATAALLLRILNPQKLVLTGDGLLAPRSLLSRTPMLIRYVDIREVFPHSVASNHFVRIVHAGGKKELPESMFASRAVFDDFCRTLAEQVLAQRSAQG